MKILVIQQKMIGDVLTSSILFEALRHQYPEAELHYLIYPHTRAVLENNPFIDKLILFKDAYKRPINFFRFINEIKDENYNVVIDVYSKIATAVISRYSCAPLRISYNKWYTSLFYTNTFDRKFVAKTKAGQAIEKRLHLLSPLSESFPLQIKPKIYLSSTEMESAKALLLANKINKQQPLYMIAVLGSSKSKTYPPEYLAEILNLIVMETNAQLLFNYIPSQRKDAELIFNLCNTNTQKNIFLDIFGKSLREFMALTSQCDALIGNEGGAVNMAKALNTPTFAIFSPSISKENWNTYEDGAKHISVHLKDFQPEKFQDITKKQLKQLTNAYYADFKPTMITPQLKHFLTVNSI
ncbi:glycosyltransferase family 9 protein [Gillisia sp. M10.2A]|uniref:Glycosyltransferase family 9 protein n=1 Tax=Gillisia lutea TaxID=2909668 RepID=A0ABS9EER1_9FLAO|nr:glycosyltransferase family 9 protein [Gillisia lutea]MCF4101336.1 glycosyltransferase family 9 protein [Gillisia lutea]